MEHYNLHRAVEAYYAGGVLNEWKRLGREGTIGWLEHYTTVHYLDDFLPRRGRVLDGGSGPGRYAIELARRGYRMTVLDPVAENLRFAERISKKEGVRGNIDRFVRGRIEDLSQLESNSFDAVVSLGGPLSHIMDAKLRRKAASELVRVAKPGAPVFASAMSRLSVVAGLLIEFPNELVEPYASTWLEHGDYKGKVFNKPVFTAFHGFLPDEFASLFPHTGFRRLRMVALEGFASRAQAQLKRLSKDKKLFNIWLKLHLGSCENPAVLGASNHMLLVGRKAL